MNFLLRPRQGYWVHDGIPVDKIIVLPNGDWIVHPGNEQRMVYEAYTLNVELYRLRPIAPKEPDDELRNAVGIDGTNEADAAATSSNEPITTGEAADSG